MRLRQSRTELDSEMLVALGRPVLVGGQHLPPITPGVLSLLDAYGSPIVHPAGDSPRMDDMVASLLLWKAGRAARDWRGYIPPLWLARNALAVCRWKRRDAMALWVDARQHLVASLFPLGMVHSRMQAAKTIDVVPDGTPRHGIDWLRRIASATIEAGFAADFDSACWGVPLVTCCHAWASVAERNGSKVAREIDADDQQTRMEQYEQEHAEELAATRAELKRMGGT